MPTSMPALRHDGPVSIAVGPVSANDKMKENAEEKM